MRNYLIPANSKKSQLILGFFTPFDLLVFGIGATMTIILLMIIQSAELGVMILILLPLLISTFLVMPVVYYHNVMQLLINVITFFVNRRSYYWKGWCINEQGKEK